MTLPKLFENRMRELLREEYEEYIKCFHEKHYSGLRVNTLKITPEEFEKICPYEIKRIPWIENGYYYDAKDQPARHPYYYAGLYYIQEPSAMTPANLLPVSPGDKVLDLCAAPGGKSTELAAKLKGEGVLVANDISNSRAKALLKNIELFGVKNAIVVSEAPAKLVNYFEGYFDKILVDAPCSGEGMFRKTPSIMKNWEQYGVDYYNKLQKEIILSAAKMLKPGGKMLYSTCTFSPEENEGTIKFLMEQYPEFRVLNPLKEESTSGVSYDGFSFGRPEWVDGPEELTNCIRLWPHRIHGEGHFITLLEKTSDGAVAGSCAENKDKISLSGEAVEFLNQLELTIDYKNLNLREDKLYLLPGDIPSIKGLRILRPGLFLGEIKKNRFEPSQALACTLKSQDYSKIINLTADNPDVVKYLKCETITVTGEYQEGWNLLCVDGYPLGWGKLSSNVLKNKYLPGWRWM
ncbi:NOL1/NOP2/sun family putative RNA methylase [Anaerocolumna sedimenticola]|uniref:NOL1/NOP2/sun family putative RNA methylase n=1 Tax=Anaerocolumna sedimenticola TaxID=2696063 RepID=A0A6P1TRR6_9FIRM|nr:RsmB/NOP family class I SAM-dependent RNA methyltransferase [Anaerocolumna sedimenticola]QHQ62118.1 NOL1/NOP2/sun family putative RNA methylase [Anaerocolumna sedimenticola]